MSLAVGTKLGPYEILALIGAGGMGEVYRARDTRLGRNVAIKVSNAEFSERFAREARSIAALNHPNICTLYDVGPNYLVMEFVEGQSPKGPMPLEEALRLASQIAEALAAAHEKGIVHRDLKPANIMITPAGTVKVLDFGLAKAVEPEPTANPETSPTLTMRATKMGMILGTAAYMSPEQARGQTVDKRADIWAFGVVLYELLTGRGPFADDDIAGTLAAVIHKEPDLTQAPEKVRRLLRRCLEKDPKKRLRDIGDAWELLDVGQAHGLSSTGNEPVPQRWPWIVATVIGVLALALGFLSYRHLTEETRVLKVSVLPPDKATFKATSLPAVSPDGRRLAFVATTEGKDQLWVRDLDSLAARALTGTEGADDPFWSPDGRTIAFFAGGKLKKIEVAGGPALTLCDIAALGRGGTWSRNDVIVFGVAGGGTFRVPAAGGTATRLTTPDRASGEAAHRFPWFLPDGRHFLYTANISGQEKTMVYAADLDSTNRKLVLAVNSNAVYTPPGYLLFVRERTLMTQPFDAGKLQTTGDAVPIAEQVDSARVADQNQFSTSQNGVLVYASGGRGGNLQLTWFDRSGKATGTLGAPGVMRFPAISPDGNTVAVDRDDTQTGIYDIWLHDLARGAASRFTFGPTANEFPAWSPDGSHIAFFSLRDGVGRPYQKATSGTARDEVLSRPLGEPPGLTLVSDWSRDGRYIILAVFTPRTKADVWVMPTFGDRKPFPYLQTEFTEGNARLSPNGQWLAYTSDETKRNEIYVQTFPTPGGKWQVSTNGGERPVWSRDGKELYFIGADGKMMAVEVKAGAKFEAGLPKPLFDSHFPSGLSRFDVSKDGRFLMPVQLEQSANAPMTVVVNWTAGLKK
jgi:Tol biopolymer transport system component/predicted Ser/Thr protein kinase